MTNIRKYLMEANVSPGCSVGFHEYTALMKDIREKFGDRCFSILMDFFTPTGLPVEPGYEDSLDTYIFDVTNWDEFDAEWNDSMGGQDE